jgi:hypothetical protein
MKPGQWVACALFGIGMILMIMAFNMGERRVVGELPSGHLMIRRDTLWHYFWVGLTLAVAAVPAFLLALRKPSGMPGASETGGASDSAPAPAEAPAEPSDDAEER